MRKQSIVILGGGIAGLAAAWRLRDHDVVVLEASPRAGGWIQTVEKEGFVFEAGPRSCRTYGHGAATLRLIDELGLQEEILPASLEANVRYLLHHQKMTKIPGSFWEWISSSFFSPLVQGVFRDLCTARIHEDCSIEEFIRKRLGDNILDLFIDALVSGIYAGSPAALSVQACFPSLFAGQQKHGSLTKSLLSSVFKKTGDKLSPSFSLFTLKRGLSSLVHQLVDRVGTSRIYYNSRVHSVHRNGSRWNVKTERGEEFSCERVISTLPGQAVEHLWGFKAPRCSSVGVVNLGYQKLRLPFRGFGYLVPSKEKESILGVVWDSVVFPEQQKNREEGRLTVMIGESQFTKDWHSIDYVEVAVNAVKRHMGVTGVPEVTHVSIADQAIPQFEVGYVQRLEKFLKEMTTTHPGIDFGGAFIDGVAINDCIYGAEKFS